MKRGDTVTYYARDGKPYAEKQTGTFIELCDAPGLCKVINKAGRIVAVPTQEVRTDDE
jgi:hypothetical protein